MEYAIISFTVVYKIIAWLFHAEYQGAEGIFNFDGEMIQGNIKSNTALKLIKEWAVLRNIELEETSHGSILTHRGKILQGEFHVTRKN